MANEARLNLVITAQDQAKAVIEEFASNIKSAFEGLKDITAGFNMNGMEQSLQGVSEVAMSTRTSLTGSIDGMKQSADTLSVSITESTDKSVQAFRSLEESLNTVSSQIQSSLDNIGQSAHHMDQSLDFMNLQMAGEMIQQVGEQITGFFEDAVSSAADFDQNVVNTTASLNANLGAVKLNTQQIKAMQDAAIKMGESGFYSANQVAEAMNTMSRNGLTYQQIMTGGIDTVYKVAAANQSDIEETANVVSDIYNEMGEIFKKSGMTAQQAADQIGNSMTVAMHHARISMEDFMGAMKYVGPQASAMGIGIKDVSAAISLLGQHGIRGSQAGTTLRRMLTNLTPASKEAAATMKQLGMITKDGSNIFYDASGKMKPLAEVQQLLHDKLGELNPQMQELAIKTIFGQYALSGMTAIVDTAPSKFTTLTAAMNNSNTMTDIMKEKSTGLGMQIQKLNAHWETIKKTIGESLKPVVESLIGGLNSLMKAWEGLSPGTQKVIVETTAIAGVLALLGGGLLATIGTIGMFSTSFGAGIKTIGKMGEAIGKLGPAFLRFGTAAVQGIRAATMAMISNPMILVITAIVAAVAIAAYEIWKHWDTVRGWLTTAWNAISHTATAVWNGVSSFFKQWGVTLLAIFMPVIGLPILIAQHWRQIQTFASQIWNAAINTIKNIWNGAIDWIKGAGQAFVNAIVNAFNWMYNHNYYFKDLVDFIKNVWATIQKDATAAWNKVTQWLIGAWNGIKSVLTQTWNGFINIISAVWNAISSAATTFWNREKTGFQNIWNGIVNVARTVWNGLTSFFSGLWSGISKGVSSAWNGIKNTISSLVNAAINALKGPFNSLGSFFSGLWGQAKQWGANLVNMMADGIKSAAGAVGNAVKGVAKSIAGFLGFHSPTKEGPGSDADMWMPNMMKMFTQGVQQHAPQLQMAIGNVALGLKTGVTTMGNTVNQNHISMPATRGNAARQTVININIDGRSAKTDNDIAENVAKKIYQQMHVIS